jgi:hypothetical protein
MHKNSSSPPLKSLKGLTRSNAELAVMAAASRCFDESATPAIFPSFNSVPADFRQAWWDGFLSSLVGAMAATIGEKQAQDSCTDLYARAKDFAADQAKLPPADIPTPP